MSSGHTHTHTHKTQPNRPSTSRLQAKQNEHVPSPIKQTQHVPSPNQTPLFFSQQQNVLVNYVHQSICSLFIFRILCLKYGKQKKIRIPFIKDIHCVLYTRNRTLCVDFFSLYPSSSQRLIHLPTMTVNINFLFHTKCFFLKIRKIIFIPKTLKLDFLFFF